VSTKHTKKEMLAASKEAGNSLNHQPYELATAWLGFAAKPECVKALNKMADALDHELHLRLPEDTLGGLLLGRESEVRQNVNLLLLERYLLGNRQLVDVTRTKGSDLDISDQIGRSINSALSIITRRMRRAAAKESARWQVLSEAEVKSGFYHHTSNLGFWDLPYVAQRELALFLLRKAASQARITPKSTALASTMVEQELTQAEMARRMHISRAAVHQQLAPVRQALRAAVEAEEISTSIAQMMRTDEGSMEQ